MSTQRPTKRSRAAIAALAGVATVTAGAVFITSRTGSSFGRADSANSLELITATTEAETTTLPPTTTTTVVPELRSARGLVV